MTYLLGANKTPELSWASRHISGLWLNRGDGRRVKKKDRYWMQAFALDSTWTTQFLCEYNRCCKCQKPATVAWAASAAPSVCYLADRDSDGWRPASGWEPNICGGSAVILNRLSASTASDGGANLGGVNQDHLSVLAAWSGGPPTHPTAGPPR